MAFGRDDDHFAVFEAAMLGLGKIEPGAMPRRVRGNEGHFVGCGHACRKGDGVALGMGDRDNAGFRARIGKTPHEAGARAGEAFEIGKGLQGWKHGRFPVVGVRDRPSRRALISCACRAV